MNSKLRLDELLLERGLSSSRSRAAELVRNGNVKVDDLVITKPGKRVNGSSRIELIDYLDYVGRGYLKLKKAMETFKLSPKNKVVCDIGSSTGGFTQLLLELGAKKIYAVDVGSNQLHETLRLNPRVVSMEKTDVRQLSRDFSEEEIHMVTSDLSFISTGSIAWALERILCNGGEYVSLVKPQFEAGPSFVSHGIVKSREVHKSTLKRVLSEFENSGLSVKMIEYSPIKGKSGNIEYLFYGIKGECSKTSKDCIIERVVTEAFLEL